MAWEPRSGTKARYYYRGERVGGQVRKVCYGSGRRAAMMARQDAQTQAARAKDNAAAQVAEVELEPLERLSIESDEQVELLMEALLLAGGFHQHKGQWRKRHGSHNESTAPARGQGPGQDWPPKAGATGRPA